MALALTLGRRGLGNVWPNPAVGAVIVKDGVILGARLDARRRPPACRSRGAQAREESAQNKLIGATMYVTLEPCSHQGKTPPCADAIIKAGIARVVSALEDPNPEVKGRGHERLRAKGITVDVGLGAEEARRVHAGHIAKVTQGRPHVLLKMAISADGKVGLAGRKPMQITGETARAARVPDARAERRHPGRHRHRAVGQSAAHLPPAGHDGALAGARGARCQAAHAARDLGGGDGARDADLDRRLAQGVADRRGDLAAARLQGVPRRRRERQARSRRRAQGCSPARASRG